MSRWWKETSLSVIPVGNRFVAGTKEGSIRCAGVQNWKASLSQNCLDSNDSFSAQEPLFCGSCAWCSPFSFRTWVADFVWEVAVFSFRKAGCPGGNKTWTSMPHLLCAFNHLIHPSTQPLSLSARGYTPTSQCLDVVQGSHSPGASRALQ